jgi:CheY-like chemotaxis protein
MPALPRPRVLVVDDYVDATNVWSLYLSSVGFDVDTASDGHEAISRVLDHLPDVVVMDLNLPGCSGIEVAKALLADPRAQHIPLIAATGCADRRELDEARRFFRLIVAKPCDPADLVAQIRLLLPDGSEQPPTHNG